MSTAESSQHSLPAALRVSAAAQAGAATGSGRCGATMREAKSSAAPFPTSTTQTLDDSKGEAWRVGRLGHFWRGWPAWSQHAELGVSFSRRL